MIFYSALILISFLLLFVAFLTVAWVTRYSSSKSPYSGMPLRRGSDLPYDSAKKILQFVYDKQEYDNRIFDIKRAAVCRETGRVFPNAITWFDTIHVDWRFLQKRYPGNYVSWGSLTEIEKTHIRDEHESLSAFQTKHSSPKASPKAIEPQYAYAKPGPLYVDLKTKVLLGWQLVPETNFEVLIVQKPKQNPYA